MSHCIYPVFKPDLKADEFDVLGDGLAANFMALDEIAQAANLTEFSAFTDNRPIPEGFDGDPDELVEITGEWDEWFDPAEGQGVMQALIDHIKADPIAAAQLEEDDWVIGELEELVRILGVAASQGAQFRLEMG